MSDIPKAPPLPRRSTIPGPPPAPRKLSRPGQYAFTDPDEEPTKPGCPKPADRWETIARLLENLAPDERRRLALLADCWHQCDADSRALLEALANKLAG